MGTRRGITITHNINVGHRLSELPGKCQQIHGHGMLVHVTIGGPISERGLLFDRDFTDIKGPLKNYLDTVWDHRLHLNDRDPLVEHALNRGDSPYPGVALHDGDPTTENIAHWVGEWVRAFLDGQVYVSYEDASTSLLEVTSFIHVEVEETPHNAAFWTWERSE